jgi:uncharacterized protein (TIGR02246 family)
MGSDEQAIRDVIANWKRATLERDDAQLASLMAEDAVFLTPGNPPMRGRDTFMRLLPALQRFRVDSSSDIEEIRVTGEWAYCWTSLRVVATPLDGGPAIRRSGNTLSIFQKEKDGRWVLARDANMLTVEPE